MKLFIKSLESYFYLEYFKLQLIQEFITTDVSWFKKLKCTILSFILKDINNKEIIKSTIEIYTQKEIKDKKKLIKQVNGAINNKMGFDEFLQLFIKKHPIKEEEGIPAVSKYFEMDDAKFLEMMKETKWQH